jgi:hypothetical protein
MKISIEHRWDPCVKKFMEPVEAACKRLGHETRGWKGPLSGSVPYSTNIQPCDLAIIWNGIYPAYNRTVNLLKSNKVPMLFAELGWLPQRQTFQLDPQGFNIRASWAKEPLESEKKTKINISNDGHVLVMLQINTDTQITQNSKWFKNMQEFVMHVIRATGNRKVVVRKHPAGKYPPALEAAVKKCPRASWDNSKSTEEAAAKAAAVAIINSSAGIKVLPMKKLILSFGESIYRKDGAVMPMDNDLEKSKKVFADLSKLEVYEERMKEIYDRIISKQWVVDKTLEDRLDRMIKSVC